MKILKTGYAYLFYFIYNSLNVKGNILVQFKALFITTALEFLLIVSVVTYYVDFKKLIIPEDFNKLYLLIVILPLVAIKLWFFERNENWKRYIELFKEWPEERQKRWNNIMRAIVFFVTVNLIFSFYWMSQIDWSEYR